MEREKRSPPARITLWRQVGHCSLSWNVFIKLFPHVWINTHLLVTRPGRWLLYVFPLAWRARFSTVPPSIPVVSPSGRLDKGCCVGAPRGTGLWRLEGPSGEGLLTAVFHNVGSTTSLLTQYKALSYGFARRLSYGCARQTQYLVVVAEPTVLVVTASEAP